MMGSLFSLQERHGPKWPWAQDLVHLAQFLTLASSNGWEKVSGQLGRWMSLFTCTPVPPAPLCHQLWDSPSDHQPTGAGSFPAWSCRGYGGAACSMARGGTWASDHHLNSLLLLPGYTIKFQLPPLIQQALLWFCCCSQWRV